MKESKQSIALMRLNCELINIQKTDLSLAGGQNNVDQGLSAKIKRVWSNRRRLLHYVRQKIKYEYYKKNSHKLIDFVVPFRTRKVEDFLVNEYNDVGRGAVYTAVYGNYDVIEEPMYVNPNLNYFAFTDADLPLDSVWKKVDIAQYPILRDLDNYHMAKYIKMFPYEFFKDYDFSIWVDGNVNLIADTYPVAIMSKGSPMATYSNPIHDCVFTEARYMIFQGRLPADGSKIQMSDYQNAGFPEHFGMREFSIIYRDHSNKECYDLMKEWWEHVNKYTMRDQLSLPFILWKNGKTIDYIKSLGENWRWNPRFRKTDHKYQIMYSK
jgi:hypothetical protein